MSIIVAPGANLATDEASVERAADRITAADVLVLQCEVPAEASVSAATIARDAGVPVVFNPSPVIEGVIEAVLPLTSVLVVNRAERDAVDPPPGVQTVTTLGPMGVLVGDERLPAFPADQVDPAGDAFCGALATGLALGQPLVEATRLGAAAGSLAVRTAGAQTSLPGREAVMRVHPFPFL